LPPPRPDREPQRIAKLLARAGIASRREIERMIAEGRIAIDGKTVEKPATLLTSLHGVTVDGNPVKAPAPARLFRYHKPVGLLTAERDPQGRPTIYDRLPTGLPRLMPVGRLDLNTEGLLLLTTDGGLKRQLELPSSGIERVYRARVFGEVSQDRLEELIQGVEIEGVRYGAIDANLERRTGRNAWVEMRLTEGKNREVRRVLEHLGLKVSRLIRTAYGPFALGDLPAGAVDEVRQHDLVLFQKWLANPAAVTMEAIAGSHPRRGDPDGSRDRRQDKGGGGSAGARRQPGARSGPGRPGRPQSGAEGPSKDRDSKPRPQRRPGAGPARDASGPGRSGAGGEGASRTPRRPGPGRGCPARGSRPGRAGSGPARESDGPVMRIIAGAWRGRPLAAPEGRGTRPTSDRAREGLFSMLASRLGGFEGLKVADLFAGTGALGLEAISRGAAHALFVDNDRDAVASIRRNLDRFGASDRGEVRAQGMEHVPPPSEPRDVIFLDPPYRTGLAAMALARLADPAWMAPGGLVSVESDGALAVPAAFEVEAERRFGKAHIHLLRRLAG
jgi:23S rRNA pseudouridine2605 synthase